MEGQEIEMYVCVTNLTCYVIDMIAHTCTYAFTCIQDVADI